VKAASLFLAMTPRPALDTLDETFTPAKMPTWRGTAATLSFQHPFSALTVFFQSTFK
jgi:hypothetical protein